MVYGSNGGTAEREQELQNGRRRGGLGIKTDGETPYDGGVLSQSMMDFNF